MKILFDECVDQRLRKELPGYEITTVQEAGWAGKKNGELLRLAQERFQVFITVDQNLYFQQNLSKFSIAVLILTPKTNEFADLRSLAPEMLDWLSKTKGNEVGRLVRKNDKPTKPWSAGWPQFGNKQTQSFRTCSAMVDLTGCFYRILSSNLITGKSLCLASKRR